MARGNWSIYKPKPRCFACGIAIKTNKDIRRPNNSPHTYCKKCFESLRGGALIIKIINQVSK